MQIQPETIIWNTPAPGAVKIARPAPLEVLSFRKFPGDRINGSMPVWQKPETIEENFSSALSEAARAKSVPATALAEKEAAVPDDSSFGFLDVIDMINPLQHIPVVSSIYRYLTGDAISPVSRVVGGTAFGGPIGAASGIVNALVQMETGKDVGENVIASFSSDPSEEPDTTLAVADLRRPAERVPVYNS